MLEVLAITAVNVGADKVLMDLLCGDLGIVDHDVGMLLQQVFADIDGGALARGNRACSMVLANRRKNKMLLYRVSPVSFLKAKPKTAILLPVTVLKRL